MSIRPLLALRPLSDGELVGQLKSLVQRERAATLGVLLRLIEVERRELHLVRYSSLFAYCTDRLRYSPSAAGRRIRAARCLRDFPRVYDMLLDGRINLSTLCIVSRVLAADNEADLLTRVAGRPQAEVERIVASLSGPEKPRDRIRPIRCVGVGAGNGNTGIGSADGDATGAAVATDSGPGGDPARYASDAGSAPAASAAPEQRAGSATTQMTNASLTAQRTAETAPVQPAIEPSLAAQRTAETAPVQPATEPSPAAQQTAETAPVQPAIEPSLAAQQTAETAPVQPAAEPSLAAQRTAESAAVQPAIEPSPAAQQMPAAEATLHYRIEITVDASFKAKLERARALVSRGHPNASLSDVLGRALDEFLQRHDPERRLARRQLRSARPAVDSTADSDGVSRPSSAALDRCGAFGSITPSEQSEAPERHETAHGVEKPREVRERTRRPRSRRLIPAALRDLAWCRDGGRCTYQGPEGRCPETRGLHIDHITPVGMGGRSVAENLRLLCARHNRCEADRAYGRDFMDLHRRRTPAAGVAAQTQWSSMSSLGSENQSTPESVPG